ncbi:beta-L-arabinofuranosidase domain-containing protein, partial [Thermotoga sp.]|uniref:beta-L-arabinofuranosidase domain-containing protein n=1 Tax=Thermotoga sp. TaxID=28240 RepID=UPI0026013A7E
MEQVLYNGLLAGISLDGRHYFYFNPLEDSGRTRRQKWFDCACCPPNLARFIASLPGYMYTVSNKGIQVHLYEKSSAEFLFKGSSVKIEQETDYPWNGHVYFTIETSIEEPFSIYLRVPSWSNDLSVRIDGKEYSVETQNGYVELNRCWDGKHTIEFSLKMKPELIEAHPLVRNNLGKVAVRRGPIVYCAEQVDNPNFHVWTLTVDSEGMKEEKGRIFDREVVFLKGTGKAIELSEWKGKLYRSLSKAKEIPVLFTLVPYCAWANREPGSMAVWLGKA